MEYGAPSGRFQSMEGYGMSMADGHCPEMGQEYDQSRLYGGGMMSSYDDSSRNPSSGSAAFGGPGYRSPLRYSKTMREMNSRNGLYTPEQRAGRGAPNYYTSLPGLGGHEPQMSYQNNNAGSQYF